MLGVSSETTELGHFSCAIEPLKPQDIGPIIHSLIAYQMHQSDIQRHCHVCV